MAAGGAGRVGNIILGLAGAGVVGESTAGTTTVELDAVALAGDTVSLTRAVGGARGGGKAGRAAGRDGAIHGWAGVVLIIRVLEGRLGEAGGELVDGWLLVVGVDDVEYLVGLLGLGRDDLGSGAALWDLDGLAGWLGLGSGGANSRDIEDVQHAAGGGLLGGGLGGVVGDVVPIDDVVVPVSLSLLKSGWLESEGSLEATGGLLVSGERELTVVVVP